MPKKGVPIKARRMREISDIIKEAQSAKEKGFRRIYFLDSFFLAKKAYLMEFFDAYKKAQGIPFFAQLHPEQVLDSPELLDAALEAGMDESVIGIQSGSERINKEIFNRYTPHEKILEFANMMVGRGALKVDYHLITHNPFEDESDYEETLELIKKLPKKNAYLVLRPLYAFKNTEIHRKIEEENPPALDINFHNRLLLLYLIRYSSPDHEFEKVRLNFKNMDFQQLSEAYANIKKTYKSDSDWVTLGVAMLNQNNYEGALQASEKALAINDGFFHALNLKGWASLKKGDLEQAEACFRKALKSWPIGDRLLWAGFIEVLSRTGRFQEIVDCGYRAKGFISPAEGANYTKILLNLGWAHLQLEETERARQCLGEAASYVDDEGKIRIARMLKQNTGAQLPLN
jgi:tetratricopeptide (TPR) repeat protein